MDWYWIGESLDLHVYSPLVYRASEHEARVESSRRSDQSATFVFPFSSGFLPFARGLANCPTSSASAMAAPHSSLAGWIPRPAPFNASKHGTNVEFSEQCSVAERVRPGGTYQDGVVYTAQPVPLGEVWRITVLSTMNKWSGELVSGWVLCCISRGG